MPIVFIHGVNTRWTDAGYVQAVGCRRAFFERIVVKALQARFPGRFPGFAVLPDIYWGDLGVSFAWGLKSIPATSVLVSLGSGATPPENLDLFMLLATGAPAAAPSSVIVSLGPTAAANPLVAAVERNPMEFVRAIFAPEAARFDPREPTAPATPLLTAKDWARAESEGEHLALMLLAADEVARKASHDPNLLKATTDAEVLEKIQDETTKAYSCLAVPPAVAAPNVVTLGALDPLENAARWVRKRIENLVNGATTVATTVRDEALRASTLLLFKALRDEASRRGLRFLGDVFVYLERGRLGAPSINSVVVNGIKAAAAVKNTKGEREPLIVVTHSFGSELLYDALTADDFPDDLTIDLWVTVGAQTSLFAEMRLYKTSPSAVPSATHPELGKPPQVRRWINFYDPADALSFMHEPVFGEAAVSDILVGAGANAVNAHGHYFVVPSFYERIAQDVGSLCVTLP